MFLQSSPLCQPENVVVSKPELAFFRNAAETQLQRTKLQSAVEKRKNRPYRHMPPEAYLWWNGDFRYVQKLARSAPCSLWTQDAVPC